MSIITLYANIQQTFPYAHIPACLLTERLRQNANFEHSRLRQKFQARWVAHFLLWQGLQYWHIDPSLLTQIHVSHNGRPEFTHQHIDFNISHSGNWVAVIMSNEAKSAVGIDIEFVAKQRDYLALMKYFASPSELNWFQQQTDPQQSFYRCWCIREAILKSQGAGIAHLSAVQHSPEDYSLTCQYCPQGSLYYSQHLPFYLAMFSADNFKNYQLLQWHNNQLNVQKLINPMIYQVNQ